MKMDHRRRRDVTALAGLLGAAALLALPSPAAAAPSTCSARGSTTLASSDQVRVYRVGTRYHACAYANGRRQSLSRLVGTSEFRSIGDLTVAGRYVAFTRGNDTPDFRVERLYVRDVRKARWLHRNVNPVVAEAGIEPGEGVQIEELAIDGRGRAAWTLHYEFEPEGHLRTQVASLTRAGRKTLLDADITGSPTGIDPTSLALSERFDQSRIYWMHGATARTATVS